MQQPEMAQRKKKSISLTARVSGLLMLATILPLLVTVVIIEVLSRPALIAQTSQEMTTDAQTHTQLIDDYFAQQLLETDSLSRLQPVQKFLSGDKSDAMKALAQESLASGRSRGSYYEDWALLDLQGNPQLYYPTAPIRHGKYYISPANLQNFRPSDLQQIQARSSLISDVFYNKVTNEAYIDIYAPVFSTNYRLVGILRATFDLHYIWDIVNKEAGANGPGSYALIFDQQGVCIAHTNPDQNPFASTASPNLFKAAAPLSAKEQQIVNENGLYGMGATDNVPVLDQGQQLAAVVQNGNSTTTFQATPPGMQATFQGAKSYASSVHWTYLVMSPLNNVTVVADDQLRLMGIVTFAILIIAALLGLGVGRRMTYPILRSVERLRLSSQALKTLAGNEQSAATQQTWVVDSSQVGLQTVQYYTQAAGVALQQLSATGRQLADNWQHISAENARTAVKKLVENAQYIERAMYHQNVSNKKLESTINVTIQVADQLASGATSATEAAEQLEQVVSQLEQVIGK